MRDEMFQSFDGHSHETVTIRNYVKEHEHLRKFMVEIFSVWKSRL